MLIPCVMEKPRDTVMLRSIILEKLLSNNGALLTKSNYRVLWVGPLAFGPT